MHLDQGSNPQPRCMPWLGIKPANFGCTRQPPNQLSHLARASNFLKNYHSGPERCGSVGCTSHKAKGRQFDPWSGHMPGSLVRSWSVQISYYTGLFVNFMVWAWAPGLCHSWWPHLYKPLYSQPQGPAGFSVPFQYKQQVTKKGKVRVQKLTSGSEQGSGAVPPASLSPLSSLDPRGYRLSNGSKAAWAAGTSWDLYLICIVPDKYPSDATDGKQDSYILMFYLVIILLSPFAFNVVNFELLRLASLFHPPILTEFQVWLWKTAGEKSLSCWKANTIPCHTNALTNVIFKEFFKTSGLHRLLLRPGKMTCKVYSSNWLFNNL